MRQSKSTSAGTGTVGMGAEVENEMTISVSRDGLKTVNQVIGGEGGVSAGPVNVSIGGEKNMTTGESYMKTSVGVGVEGSFTLGVRYEAKGEVKKKRN